MYRSLLVPLDGSAFGEHALPLALNIAQRAAASLLLVHVQAPVAAVYAEGPLFLDDALLAQLQVRQRQLHQQYLDGVVQRIKKVAPSLAVSTVLVEGNVPGQVREMALGHHADLVVLTTHGRGPLARFWLGSVADDLIRHSSVPLLLVHGTQEPIALTTERGICHVLAPLDGTPPCEDVLEPAAGLATLMNADITLERVIKPVLATGYPMAPGAFGEMAYALMDQIQIMQTKLTQEAMAYLERLAEGLRKRGLIVHCKVEVDEAPAHAIVKDAAPPTIDLVALSTHGRTGLSRLFLGSITEKVVHNAAVPVLVHRPRQLPKA